jgi:hypothetical protein
MVRRRANIARRHLSKGQIAMAAAKMRSVSEQSVRQAARLSKVSATRIANAEIVLQFAPDLADSVLAKADRKMVHGEFEAMVEKDLPFRPRTARMLMAIARDERLTDRKHVSVLPPSWGTLYLLTKLTGEEFEARLAAGLIRPDLERNEIAKWHLTESQRAIVAATIANLKDGQRKAAPPIDGAVSQADAARLLNVSPKSVERAAAVRRDGVPELVEAVHGPAGR